MATASAPSMRDGPLRGERRDRKRHRHAMIAARVGDAARRPARRCRWIDDNPSASSSASMPSARKPATSAAMRSLSLTRSSLGAAHGHLAAVRRERRDGRQLVDQAGHFLGRDVERADADRLRR